MMGTKVHNNYEDLITFTRASKGHALRPVSYGTELVTNGDYSDGTTGWTNDSSLTMDTFEIDSGRLHIENTAGTTQAAYTDDNISLVAGKIYKFTAELEKVSGNDNWDIDIRVAALSTVRYTMTSTATTETLQVIFVATQTENTVIQITTRDTFEGYIDNVSVKEVTFDESDGTLTLFEHPNNVPRVEYDADGNRLGLLVEESRTNLTTISEPTASELSNSTNVSDGDFNNSLGLSNGIKFDDNSTTRFAYRSATVSSGQDYTVSVFVKMDDGSTPNVGNNTTSGDFGLVVGSSLVTSGSNISITAMSDNVFRVSGTRTATSTDNNHGVIKYTGQSTKGFTVTGFQIEQASFHTSYIRTTGSTATRSADVASIPVADFGFNASEGTFLFEYRYLALLNNQRGFSIASDGSNLMGHYQHTSNSRWWGLDGGVTQYNLIADSSGSADTAYKFASVYKENDFAVTQNGGTVATDTSATVPTVDTLRLGASYAGANQLNGHIKSIKYYPRRLTNAQLQDLTS